MLKKVWFMLVLLSVLMVSGCFGGMQKDNTDSVAVTADVVAVDNSDTSVGTEQTETSETEKQSGNSFNVEASNTEESTADTTTTEIDAEPPTTEAPSEPETITTQPATDDRGNPADGSPVFEITFNIPQAEYVGYDADRVARLAVEKCKAAGMITLPENLDRLLAEGKITQEEYDEYYPYDGCGYYSVFVEKDGILYPLLTIPADMELSAVGKYGLLWLSYMRENHKGRLRTLTRLGCVNRTAHKVNEEAYEMLDVMISLHMRKHPPVSPGSTIEKWKLREQAKSVAEETVLMDIVYQYH